MFCDTIILNFIPRIIGAEIVKAVTKKKDLNSLPSRADIPKMKHSRFKKKSIIDPVVLLA